MATKATVAPIIKNENIPFASAILYQSLFNEIQLSINIANPIAMDKNTHIKTPISRLFIFDSLLLVFV